MINSTLIKLDHDQLDPDQQPTTINSVMINNRA